MPPPPDRAPNFPEPRSPVILPALPVGSEVLAFFHANHHPNGLRYVRTLHRADITPLVGLSSGWLRATLLDGWDPVEAQRMAAAGDMEALYIHVRFNGVFRDTMAGASDGLDMPVHAGLVKVTGDKPPAVVLSALVVRWWDYWSNTTWSDYSVTNDGLLRDLVDGPCGMYATLAGEFEVYTVFVRCTLDVERISAHWAQAALHGANTVAWYFLWPQQSVFADRTGGCIREKALFALAQRMERCGIRSGWPHPSSLYRQLCGKLWIPQMSLNRDFRVPPTTRVQYADVSADAGRAADQAVAALRAIRREIWGDAEAVPEGELRGVAKLGFSWQGDDVLPFRGAENLARVLVRLLEQKKSEQVLCLVQEMVPEVLCEYRVLCFRDAARGGYTKEHLWMRMKTQGEHHLHQTACEVNDFALASANVISSERAAGEFFGGSRPTRDRLEADVDRLVDRWLLWFTSECADPPPVTRLDFLVSKSGGDGGGPSAWTCEVGECGASLCSVECDARNAATLNWAVRKDSSGRFPLPLPAITRNNGWKS